MRRHPILFATLIAGTLDITSAFILSYVLRGSMPVRVLQGIATGFYGRASFEGGYRTAAVGLAVHYLIAFTASAVFYFAALRIRTLIEHPFLFGPLYGIAVWLVMNGVVIPLSRVNAHYDVRGVVIQLLIHMFIVGLPIALVTRAAAIPSRRPEAFPDSGRAA